MIAVGAEATYRNVYKFTADVPETLHNGHPVEVVAIQPPDPGDEQDGPMYRVKCGTDDGLFDVFGPELDQWAPGATGHPGDQERELDVPGYWAEVGPEGDSHQAAWSWSVLRYGGDGAPEASGVAHREAEAKAAVAAWEAGHSGQVTTT